jgi:hypothetical protein
MPQTRPCWTADNRLSLSLCCVLATTIIVGFRPGGRFRRVHLHKVLPSLIIKTGQVLLGTFGIKGVLLYTDTRESRATGKKHQLPPHARITNSIHPNPNKNTKTNIPLADMAVMKVLSALALLVGTIGSTSAAAFQGGSDGAAAAASAAAAAGGSVGAAAASSAAAGAAGGRGGDAAAASSAAAAAGYRNKWPSGYKHEPYYYYKPEQHRGQNERNEHDDYKYYHYKPAYTPLASKGDR